MSGGRFPQRFRPKRSASKISLDEQMVRAFEYDQEVYTARISSGLPNSRLLEADQFPTATPIGKVCHLFKDAFQAHGQRRRWGRGGRERWVHFARRALDVLLPDPGRLCAARHLLAYQFRLADEPRLCQHAQRRRPVAVPLEHSAISSQPPSKATTIGKRPATGLR